MNFTPFSGKIWYPKSYYIDQGYNCHYQRIQGVLTRNKRHLRLGRVPKLFQALRRPAMSPLSKCMLTKKTRATITFFKGMDVTWGLPKRSHIIVLILPKHTCFGVLMWFSTKLKTSIFYTSPARQTFTNSVYYANISATIIQKLKKDFLLLSRIKSLDTIIGNAFKIFSCKENIKNI